MSSIFNKSNVRFLLLVFAVLLLMVFPVIIVPVVYIHYYKIIEPLSAFLSVNIIAINCLLVLPLLIWSIYKSCTCVNRPFVLGCFLFCIYVLAYMLMSPLKEGYGLRAPVFKQGVLITTSCLILLFTVIKIIRAKRGLKFLV